MSRASLFILLCPKRLNSFHILILIVYKVLPCLLVGYILIALGQTLILVSFLIVVLLIVLVKFTTLNLPFDEAN